jgi:hypothetical protein
MSRQVFPQAPSPTITSLRRISAILCVSGGVGWVWAGGAVVLDRQGVSR